MKVIFDVKHLYYLPQYLPVYAQLQERGITCEFVFYQDSALNDVMLQVIKQEQLAVRWVNDWSQALQHYLTEQVAWIIFGNAVDDIHLIHQHSQTVLMQHGIGPKACYYDVSQNLTTVRFVEGQHRLRRLLEYYPRGNFVDTGYAKLDPIFNHQCHDMTLSQ